MLSNLANTLLNNCGHFHRETKRGKKKIFDSLDERSPLDSDEDSEADFGMAHYDCQVDHQESYFMEKNGYTMNSS